MKININDHRKIFAIQHDFSEMFPYLKLAFYSKPSSINGAASKKTIKHPSKTLGECRTIHNKGIITITPSMTVGELAQNFSDVYGLSIHVYRKSGKMWLETTLTDNWTLEKQNKQGEELERV